MLSEQLKKAREYEEQQEPKVPEELRPSYHFSPRVGWLNDPNGFSFYGGRYHLFYQYHPYDSHWGPMHWGHAVSQDLISWEYLPAVLAPDQPYDNMGCFSGSAITMPNGKHMLMYTGCSEDKDDERGRWKQVQCIAFGNGTDYEKYDGNPVITSEDLPEGGSIHEFRDPYIYSNGAGRYFAVAANANKDNDGVTQICLYRSDDALHWRRESILFEDRLKIGIMWECPNFFQCGSDYVLIASPMDMEQEEADGSIRFPKGNNVCYMLGGFDDEAGKFRPYEDPVSGRYKYEPVDLGLDFYAPQVLQASDGRKIMLGWMQDPATAMAHDKKRIPIFGQMTVPRELFVKNGMLCQRPIAELRTLRAEGVNNKIIIDTSSDVSIEGVSGRSTELIIHADRSDEMYKEFIVRFAAGSGRYTQLVYRPGQSILTIDRSNSGLEYDAPMKRTVRVRDKNGRITLRILIDKWSAEVFINDGEQVMSATFYTDPEANGITFSAEGKVMLDVTSYRMRSHKDE